MQLVQLSVDRESSLAKTREGGRDSQYSGARHSLRVSGAESVWRRSVLGGVPKTCRRAELRTELFIGTAHALHRRGACYCIFVRNVSPIKRLPLFRARFLNAKRLRNGRQRGLATTSGALCAPPLGQLTTCNHQS
eukprot:COSAG06_NODE_3631_length_5096_cov_5.007004_2_plen_135_part_00